MIKLGTRKTILQNQSLFVNIPMLWVDNNEIRPKQKLNILWDQEKNALIITKEEVENGSIN